MSAVADTSKLTWLNRRAYPFAPHHMMGEGGRLHYIDEGSGSPIVFLHGSPTWSFMFRNVIREMSRDYRCVALDHIGFGLSDKPTDFSYSPANHCRNLTKLIGELGLKDITLVMHDFGGPVGLSYALDHLDNVKRIVLSNTWMWDLSKDPAAQKVGKVASNGMGKFMYLNTCVAPKLIKPLFCDRTKYTDDVHAAYFGPFEPKEDRVGTYCMAKHLLESGAWYSEIWAQREALMQKQMLLLWGLKDPTFGEKSLNKVWHEFPLVDVHSFDDTGHFLYEEKPREIVAALRAFMTAPVKTTGYIA